MPKIVDHEEERKAIALATIRWIATHGIETLSQRNVAKSCGRSKGGLQYYYPNKRMLMLGALEQITRLRENEEVSAAGGCSDTPLEKLRLRLAAALPVDRERRDAWRARLAFYVYAHQDAEMQALIADHADDILQSGGAIVRACQDAGLIRTDADPRRVFQKLQMVVSGIAVAALAWGDNLMPEEQYRILNNSLDEVTKPKP